MFIMVMMMTMRDIFVWFFCCIILASLHFNDNLLRGTQLTKDGEKYLKVTYPKYKLGEEVVHKVASPPTYCEFNYSTGSTYMIFQPGVIHFFEKQDGKGEEVQKPKHAL